MGHSIQCIIGKDEVISELETKWIKANQLHLKEGFSLIPVTNELLDDITELANIRSEIVLKDFIKLSKSLDSVLRENSYIDKIGYIETDYFGGTGTQAALCYSQGNIDHGPLVSKTKWNKILNVFVEKPKGRQAINSVLYKLGVPKRSNRDAFDYLGLSNFRSNEKILEYLQC